MPNPSEVQGPNGSAAALFVVVSGFLLVIASDRGDDITSAPSVVAGDSKLVEAPTDRTSHRPAHPVEVARVVEAAEPEPSVSLPFLGSDRTQEAIAEEMRTRRFRRLTPVGSTSIVFRVEFEGGGQAAFKPRTRRHPDGYRAEAAAYEIARLLHLDNVPPVVLRSTSRDELRATLDPETDDPWESIDEGILWDGNSTPGAVIHWIPEMAEMGLDTPEGLLGWTRDLAHDAAPTDDRIPLLRDLSNAVLFDYLIANWDRFSGANLQGHVGLGRVFIRDHNVAFRTVTPRLQSLMIEKLERTERFDRGVVMRIAQLDPATLARLPLTIEQIQEMIQRRATILSYVGAVEEAYGATTWLGHPETTGR